MASEPHVQLLKEKAKVEALDKFINIDFPEEIKGKELTFRAAWTKGQGVSVAVQIKAKDKFGRVVLEKSYNDLRVIVEAGIRF